MSRVAPVEGVGDVFYPDNATDEDIQQDLIENRERILAAGKAGTAGGAPWEIEVPWQDKPVILPGYWTEEDVKKEVDLQYPKWLARQGPKGKEFAREVLREQAIREAEPRTDADRTYDFIRGFAQAVPQMVTEPLEFFGETVPSYIAENVFGVEQKDQPKPMSDLARLVEEKLEEALPESPLPADAGLMERLPGALGSGLGSVVGMVGPQAALYVTKLPKAIRVGGQLVQTFGAEAQGVFDRTIQRQVREGRPIDTDEAMGNALVYGTGATALEYVGGVPRLVRQFGRPAAEAAETVTVEGLKALRKSPIKEGIVQTLTEGGTELTQSLLEQQIVEGKIDPMEAALSLIAGSFAGGLTSTGMTALRNRLIDAQINRREEFDAWIKDLEKLGREFEQKQKKAQAEADRATQEQRWADAANAEATARQAQNSVDRQKEIMALARREDFEAGLNANLRETREAAEKVRAGRRTRGAAEATVIPPAPVPAPAAVPLEASFTEEPSTPTPDDTQRGRTIRGALPQGAQPGQVTQQEGRVTPTEAGRILQAQEVLATPPGGRRVRQTIAVGPTEAPTGRRGTQPKAPALRPEGSVRFRPTGETKATPEQLAFDPVRWNPAWQ